jgi:hypothetical protein
VAGASLLLIDGEHVVSGKKITLKAWAQAHFDPPPAAKTLQRWARNCWIFPVPEKIGRTYYVDPDARFTGSSYDTKAA